MEENLLKEQLEKLEREQTETENAYSENFGKIDESILIAWLQEILDREEKINELKQRIPEKAEELEENDIPEEKSLVNTEGLGIVQKIRQIEADLQRDFNHTPGLSTEALGDLRQNRMKKYADIVKAYTEKKNSQEEKGDQWKLDPEAERIFRQGEKGFLSNQNRNHKSEVNNQEREPD